jgi:hypothetical protein
MNSFQPLSNSDANYYNQLQERQQRLLEELKQKEPSLFSRMMKAGLLAVLGMIGANILDQDPMKGAVAGAAAGVFINPKVRTNEPSYR